MGRCKAFQDLGPEITFPHILVPQTSHRTSPYKEKSNMVFGTEAMIKRDGLGDLFKC